MKKTVLAVALVLTLVVCSISALAAPADHAAQWQSTPTTLKSADVKDGTEFTMSMSLYIDPSYDYFDGSNMELKYDNKLIEMASANMNNNFSCEDAGYTVAPMRISDTQVNLLVGNVDMAAPGSDGYCCKVTVTMKVVDAAAFIKAGGATVSVSLHNNDFGAVADGELYIYADIVEGIKDFNQTVSLVPMSVKVDGGSVTPPVDNTWSITFNTNGGTAVDTSKVEKGQATELPTTTKDGFTFDGWYTDEGFTTKANSPFTPTADTILYAKWTETTTPAGDTYKVTYNTNGGNAIDPANVKKGESVTLPTPTKSGYTFAGWYTDEGLATKVTDATYKPTADTTLYAKWTVSNGAGAGGAGTTGAGTTVPKTGASNSIVVLLSAMGVLVLGAGTVIFVRYRKIKNS